MYHDTLPSEFGQYRNKGGFTFERDDEGRWWSQGCMVTNGWIESQLPLLGPCPVGNDAMLALACEVQFARMTMARLTNGKTFADSMEKMRHGRDEINRFVNNERSLSLYRDMERVMRELSK